jgi:type IV secretory pathway ATPase VirB11/archaellum biosynthesis ATPase
MNDAIARHCEELNRCNQRGGRMLSVFDLLATKTLDLDLAAYLMARISRGASFMVGSVPGGAGKTTVMCALLNFVPANVPLIAATPQEVYTALKAATSPRACYICHEIGSGSYFAYLWSDALRTYCRLSENGHMLATNLHADDLDEARDQVCSDNDVRQELFNRFELLMFLRIEGTYLKTRRLIETVYSSDGLTDHVLVFYAGNNKKIEAKVNNHMVKPDYVNVCRDFLKKMSPKTRTIEQTRRQVVEFLAQNLSL